MHYSNLMQFLHTLTHLPEHKSCNLSIHHTKSTAYRPDLLLLIKNLVHKVKTLVVFECLVQVDNRHAIPPHVTQLVQTVFLQQYISLSSHRLHLLNAANF